MKEGRVHAETMRLVCVGIDQLLDLPTPGLSAVLLHYTDIGHHHTAVDGFAHIVNGKNSTHSVRKIKGLEDEGDSDSPILKG